MTRVERYCKAKLYEQYISIEPMNSFCSSSCNNGKSHNCNLDERKYFDWAFSFSSVCGGGGKSLRDWLLVNHFMVSNDFFSVPWVRSEWVGSLLSIFSSFVGFGESPAQISELNEKPPIGLRGGSILSQEISGNKFECFFKDFKARFLAKKSQLIVL